MKDHEIAELVNKVTEISREFHGHASLRDRISRVVVAAIKPPLSIEEQRRTSRMHTISG